jgi:hypothetical protein
MVRSLIFICIDAVYLICVLNLFNALLSVKLYLYMNTNDAYTI